MAPHAMGKNRSSTAGGSGESDPESKCYLQNTPIYSTSRESDHSPEKWMSRLEDDVPVSALSIPGTHDSAAFTHQWPFISTQKMNILQQLNAGIRYFDLRCGLRNNIAEMVHGTALLGLRLSDVLSIIYDWLNEHPTEALVVQIKEDREPEQSTVYFSQAISTYISVRSAYWRTANTTPVLGELRGKIQLLRRFRGPSLVAYGIDVTAWQDNPITPFTIKTSHCVQLTIQDHYSFEDPTPLPGLIAGKGADVSDLLQRASADGDRSHWYLNFTSAYEFNLWYQVSPRQLAVGGYYSFTWEDGINPRLRNYLRTQPGKHRLGVIAMDFPDLGAEDLINTIIQSNFKQKKSTWTFLLGMLCVLVMIGFGFGWRSDMTAACAFSSSVVFQPIGADATGDVAGCEPLVGQVVWRV